MYDRSVMGWLLCEMQGTILCEDLDYDAGPIEQRVLLDICSIRSTRTPSLHDRGTVSVRGAIAKTCRGHLTDFFFRPEYVLSLDPVPSPLR